MAYILGIDCSKWQDNNNTPARPDMWKAYNNGAKFMIARLSYGLTSSSGIVVDEDGQQNHYNASAVILKLLENNQVADFGIGAYHYLSWTTEALAQSAFFCDQVDNHPDKMPSWLDCECSLNIPSKAKTTRDILDALYDIEYRTKWYAGVYTRASWWNDHVEPDPAFLHFLLWDAHYYVEKPAIPKPWTDWDIWQYSAIGNGAAYGMESKALDLNWCQHPDKVGLTLMPTIEERITGLERDVCDLKLRVGALEQKP